VCCTRAYIGLGDSVTSGKNGCCRKYGFELEFAGFGLAIKLFFVLLDDGVAGGDLGFE